MSTTTSSSGDQADERNVDDAPTVMLGAASDRCSRCGAQLAVDQRYCVECGTRRGRPRFLLTPAPGTPPASGSGAGSGPSGGWRGRVGTLTSSSTLLLGILVLLLAIGIGVLIGHNNNGSGTKQARNIVNVTVPSGGASAGTVAPAGSASSGSSSSTGSSSSGSTSTTASSSSKAAKTKTTAAKTATTATKAPVSSGGVSKSQNKPAAIGSSCTAGTAGCVNGKETGSFF